MDSTPAMWNLAGIYLNQDWPDEYDDEWVALDAFVTEFPQLAPALPGEIDWMLRTFPAEPDLEAYVTGQGAAYVPDAELGYRGWLLEVARRVAAQTGAEPGSPR